MNDYSVHYSVFHPNTTEHCSKMSAAAASELSPLLPEPSDRAVLDIGCGFGYAIMGMRRLGFTNVEGVEISPQQAERAATYGLRVSVVDDTAKWLRERPGRYAVILMMDVLEHIQVADQVDFLRAVYGSLAPGGRVVIKTPNANSPLASRWRYIDHTHHCSFTEHSLSYAMACAGFEDIKLMGANLQRPSLRLWRKGSRKAFFPSLRRYVVRWCWLQVYKAELPQGDNWAGVCFDLNYTAVAYRLSRGGHEAIPHAPPITTEKQPA